MADNPVPLRAKLEELAKTLGCVINPYQEHKIPQMVELGRCACTPDGSRHCPCDFVVDEVLEYGSCLCRVVVTEKYLKKHEAYLRRQEKKSAAAKGPEPAHDGPVQDVPAAPDPAK